MFSCPTHADGRVVDKSISSKRLTEASEPRLQLETLRISCKALFGGGFKPANNNGLGIACAHKGKPIFKRNSNPVNFIYLILAIPKFLFISFNDGNFFDLCCVNSNFWG